MGYEKEHALLLELGNKLIEKNPELREWVESKIPELRESEDEKIRKDLINYFRDHKPLEHKEKDAIAWLEKQDEQKPVWSEGDKKMINLLIKIFEVNHPNGHFKVKVNPIGITNMEDISTKEIVDWLKSIKPQKRWKPTEQNIEDLEWCADLVQDKMGVGFHRLQVFIDELKQL